MWKCELHWKWITLRWIFIDYLITNALLNLSICGSYCRVLKNNVIRGQRNDKVKQISARNIILGNSLGNHLANKNEE